MKAAKKTIATFCCIGDVRHFEKTYNNLDWLKMGYNAFHALALDSKKRRALMGALLQLEAFVGDEYDVELREKGAL